ncbi:hypothetical protein [Bacillus kexueae]|uniref:hypothetical protein n=1 Tax=Aeribacillus kexueae TaxID=2078952 RepID=UPI001FAE8FF5|nr:hypothetical protein [Bacillus kexueae]
MVIRAFLYITGFGLTIAGGVCCIAYLNMMTWGNTFLDYLLFIAKRPECYLVLIGFLMITLSVMYPNRNEDIT